MIAAATLDELVRRRAVETPRADVLRFEGQALGAAELDERCRRTARALADAGVAPGDRVLLYLPNGVDVMVAWLGVVRRGAIAVPAHAMLRERDLGHLVSSSGAKLAVTDAAGAPVLARAGGNGALRDVWVDLGPARAAPADAGDARASPDDVVALQYTSGTTGLPKGCMLTHEFWLTLAGAMAAYAPFGPDDVALSAQPASYMDPMWNLFLGLATGMPLALLPRFSATTFWRSAVATGATFFYCLGTMPLVLAKQPIDPALERGHRLRFVLCSGIPAARHAELEARYGCPWRETYGTTELGAVLFSPLGARDDVGTGALGDVCAGKEIRVVRDDGAVAGPGESGELWVRGRGLMRGYFHDPGATSAWCPDGWARTGDQVALDARGRPRHVGRRRDVIRRGGQNIAAAEVEAVLAEHPGVRQAACVPVPDDVRGEEVKAYVVTTSPGAASPEALVDFVRERLAPFKAPRYVDIVAALPMTPSERVAKALLARAIGPRTYDADEPIALREVARLVARADSVDLAHMLELETDAVLACLADPQLARRVKARVGDRGPDPSPGPDVRVDRDGRLATITLARPHVANALRARSCGELVAILEALAADPSVAGVILTGAGRAFSAGEDLRELVAGLPGSAAAVLPVVQDLTRRIASHPARVVAAVNGPAVGLGAELAIACHAAVAARGAFLSFPEAQLGLLPTNGAFHFVPRRAGPALALEWFRTGAPVPVEEAARAGLVTRVVPPEDLAEAAAALALGAQAGRSSAE